MSELRKAMRSHGVNTIEGAMATTIALPPALTGVPLPDPIEYGAAFALSIIPVLRSHRRAAREQYQQSPAAYLFRLDQKLKPRKLLGRLIERVNRFLTGV